MLEDSRGDLITEKKSIAELFQQQFKSVFSDPQICKDYVPPFEKPTINFPLSDLKITNSDIIKAINEIKVSSSCPKFEIPARVFKECKHTLCTPLRILWTKSFDAGVCVCY